MKFLVTSLVAGGALIVAATGQTMAPSGGGMSGAMPGMNMGSTSETIPMKPQNASGETGTTTLRDTPRGLVVTIHIKNAKGPQPAHIHDGSCANLNPVPKYPLHNVVNGMSVTTVKGVTIAQLNGKTAVNVHKSAAALTTYVSCGDIAGSGHM